MSSKREDAGRGWNGSGRALRRADPRRLGREVTVLSRSAGVDLLSGALSIVGLDLVPSYGYYTAKLEHEAAPLPVSMMRATQLHEFPAQILART